VPFPLRRYIQTNEILPVVNEVLSVESTIMSVRPSGLPPIQEMPPPGGFRKVREIDEPKRDECIDFRFTVFNVE
jgi:hypothetical protein